eukprot:11412752-Heterocapsa_arctica.AAC.1
MIRVKTPKSNCRSMETGRTLERHLFDNGVSFIVSDSSVMLIISSRHTIKVIVVIVTVIVM